MEDKELREIKSLALKYEDPVRGKLLALIAYIEELKESK